MKHIKLRYIIGGIVSVAILIVILFGHDGELRTVLGSIIGFLFGQATK